MKKRDEMSVTNSVFREPKFCSKLITSQFEILLLFQMLVYLELVTQLVTQLVTLLVTLFTCGYAIKCNQVTNFFHIKINI